MAPAVRRPDAPAADHPGGPLGAIDQRFVAWLAARNAWTLLHRPHALFEAEPCYPERSALTLGEPGIALGIAALPAWLATGDPIASYDLALKLSEQIGSEVEIRTSRERIQALVRG